MKATFALPFLLGLAVGDVPTCAAPSSEDPVTLYYTARMTAQTPPVSTVYNTILTKYLNVVDCRYVTIETVQDNPAQTGQYTARTTSDVLTVYRVGCMVETSVSTRGAYYGYDMQVTQPLPTITALPDAGHKPKVQNKREALEAAVANEVFGIADRLSSGIDPMNENITVREFQYLEQINTALFALNIVNFGYDLTQMCEYLANATVVIRLEESMIIASQASNIICFAAEYGLYFGMSNLDLLSDLAALEYAIQVRSYPTETLQELCENLDYTAASFLGIDTPGIRANICNGTEGLSSAIVPLSTIAPSATSMSSLATRPTGNVGPIGTGSIIYGSDGTMLSSAASAAGTVAPWFNITTIIATGDMTTVTAAPGTGGPEPTAISRPLFHVPQVRRHARYRF